MRDLMAILNDESHVKVRVRVRGRVRVRFRVRVSSLDSSLSLPASLYERRIGTGIRPSGPCNNIERTGLVS